MKAYNGQLKKTRFYDFTCRINLALNEKQTCILWTHIDWEIAANSKLINSNFFPILIHLYFIWRVILHSLL